MTQTPTQRAEMSFTYASAHAHAVERGQGDLKDVGRAIAHMAEGLSSLSVALRQTYQLLAKVDKQTAPKPFAGRVEVGRAVIDE